MNQGSIIMDTAPSSSSTSTSMSTSTAAPMPMKKSLSPTPPIPLTPCCLPADVHHINDVEWASEDPQTPSPSEIATRPRFAKLEDPCGCTPAYDEATDTIDTRPCCIDPTCVLFACQEECRTNCEAGDLCGNKRITKKLWKKLQVVDAGVKGRGLVLLEDAAATDFIIEYTGVAIQKKYLDAMFRRYRMERMLYIMALDSDVYIDARKKGSIARYINHSCDPNCAVHRWKVKGVIRAGIFALRDIKAGEELSFDYQWKRKRGRAPTKCYCGAKNCRGTLEDMLDKTEEEEREEMQLQGHWKAPAKTTGVGSEIMNRTIKVLSSREENEYFMADVCKYDPTARKHCLIYRGEIEETWENLDDREWMILDEEMEQFVIGRKAKYRLPESDGVGVGVGMGMLGGSNSNSGDEVLGVHPSPHPSQRPPSPLKTKNYLVLQTPMKEMLFSKHLVDRCQRHYRVQISVKQVYASSNSLDADEAADVSQALRESKDGTAWKFDVTGLKPTQALAYIEKNIQDFIEQERRAALGIDPRLEALKERQRMTRHEIVIPRCVVDHVKNRIPLLRNNCKGVDITFAASKSMSKQFAKLIVESQDSKAAFDAQVLLWKDVLTLCNNHDAPRTPKGLFKDLAFFGGELSKDDFDLLCPKLSKVDISQDCAENLRESGMGSFEDFYRCTIWVQATEDMGRINVENRLVSDAHSGTRKIFFGSEPRRIPELWGHIKARIEEVKAGVKFLNLDNEKDFLPFISKSSFEQRPRGFGMLHSFFDYVGCVSKALVQMDNFSQNSIRIDGYALQSNGPRPIHLDGGVDDEVLKRAKTAEELIKLQLELLRDNRIRHHRWSFGRDWSLLVTTDSKTEANIIQERENNQSLNGASRLTTNSRPSHKRYIANACIEIAEISETLNLDGSIAGHACVILYRYLNQTSEKVMNVSQSKQRDILLACLFLANKAQKECKWKRLEVVLGCAYKIFYNGAKFDPEGEEGAAWEKRVLATEEEIVKVLDYDIFWGGVDWIISRACESGQMKEPVVKNVMELTLTGPVLATGAVVWLKLGPEYAFTAMAALLSFSVKDLISSLSLNPLKLSDTVELVTNSILTNKIIRRKGSKTSHDVFNGRRENFVEVKKLVKEVCKEQVILNSSMSGPQLNPSGQVKQNLIISRRYGKRRVIKGVTGTVLNGLLPHFGKIRDCCLCDIYVEESPSLTNMMTDDIILEGSWRSLAMAEDMLRELAQKAQFYLPSADDADATINHAVKLQARSRPGLLCVSALKSTDDWNDFSESGWKKKIGGKTCLPGIVQTNGLEEAGLRWWLRPNYCPTLKGSLCNMHSIRNSFAMPPDYIPESHFLEIAQVAKALDSISNNPQFPTLTKGLAEKGDEGQSFTPVSLQRWPPEKTELREQAKSGMGVGVSPAALQEMQILTKLHSVIPGPQGHPNFILPIAIAIDDGAKNKKEKEAPTKPKNIDLMADSTDNLYSFLKTLDKSDSQDEKNKLMSGSYLVFQPTPIILQRVMSKNKSKKTEGVQGKRRDLISPTILTAWFHDLLSAMAHCHANHIVLRTLHPDQIFIDNNGVAKLSGLTRSIVLHPTDRDRYLDPLSSSKNKKKSGTVTDDDMASNPYMAPELLLGATRYTSQTDVWTLAALVAHLLIGKPIFSGRDRKSKTRAIFKIVGTPSTSNYKEAQSYPYYNKCKPEKKYKSGLVKALTYMFRDGNRNNVDDYAGLLSLLERMLNLDPKKRMSASEALEHSSMTDYTSQTTNEEFHKTFAEDWKALKENLCAEDASEETKDGNANGIAMKNNYGGYMMGGNRAGLSSSSLGLNSMSAMAPYKRPSSFLDAQVGVRANDGDDLYDLGDALGSGRKDGKRAKLGK